MHKAIVEIVTTEDGSHTLFVPELNEHYHSVHGAVAESEHVFINNGLLFSEKPILSVLEVGFGTGLNTWLTAKTAVKKNISVSYTGVEAYPTDTSTMLSLNYTDNASTEACNLFSSIQNSDWNKNITLHTLFSLYKIHNLIQNCKFERPFDIIYFDAFAPDKQPDMWTESVFKQMYNALKPGGILTTYCAKGSVKRTLKSCGFEVTSLPGPPGKREMTRAQKI